FFFLAANSAWAKLVCFMIVPGRFDYREFDFIKSKAQAELISVSLRLQHGNAYCRALKTQWRGPLRWAKPMT
ncbi:hypothetical protein, partial [Marinobacter antarcticus]|uniref:hypothetical protein n=1 Tax=Marinobacter antarcticus TaxID=564117 RepID=UPI0026EB8486